MNELWLPNLEFIVAENRADFRREMEKIRLEHEALSTKPGKRHWLDNRVLDFSAWITKTGLHLRQRYEETESVPRWYQSFKLAR